jgi:hypothetical protein
MELLQNQRYKPSEITISYYHEIKAQIESMIDVCREGEISVNEAVNIVYNEMACSMDYQWNLWEKLENLEKDIQEPVNMESEKAPDYIDTSWYPSPDELKKMDYEFTKKELEKALDDMVNYHDFLIEAEEKLAVILESPDYYKKRKDKLKQYIIINGIQLSIKSNDETDNHSSKNNAIERPFNYLITIFPEFAKDYKILIDRGYLKITDNSLRWLKSKQSLSEYFKSIQPRELKRMPWTMIGSIFAEKDLKNSASSNGNEFKGISADFTEWLKIKNTP